MISSLRGVSSGPHQPIDNKYTTSDHSMKKNTFSKFLIFWSCLLLTYPTLSASNQNQKAFDLHMAEELNTEADFFGIDRGRYAALEIAAVGSQLDTSDIKSIMFKFLHSLKKPEMIQFKEDAEKNGIDKAFLNFMSAMSKMSPEKAAQHMNDVFEDDAYKVSTFIASIQNLTTAKKELSFQNIVDNMAGHSIDIDTLRKSLNAAQDQIDEINKKKSDELLQSILSN